MSNSPLAGIQSIQQLWLNEIPKHIDFAGDNSPLPDNVKAAISQADKKDQRRESLILIAQMQVLLDKPQPPELDPQLEEVPKLEGYNLLVSQSKEFNDLCDSVSKNELKFEPSILWEALHKKQIIIRPTEYFEHLHSAYLAKHSVSELSEYLPFNIYEPWRFWWHHASNHLPKKVEDLFYSYYYDASQILLKHQPQLIYNLFHQLLELNEKQIEEQNRIDPYENLIWLQRYHDLPKKEIDYLRGMQHTHHSEDARQKLSSILKSIESKKKNKTISKFEQEKLQLIVDGLSFKDGRLIETKENEYFDLEYYSLHQNLADHFGLTIDQLVDAWDIDNLEGLSNYYLFSKIMQFQPSLEVINRAYLRLCQKISKLIEEEEDVYWEYDLESAIVLAPYVSYETKLQAPIDFGFSDNYQNSDESCRFEKLTKLNDTLGSRITFEQLLVCPNLIGVLEDYDFEHFIYTIPQPLAEQYLEHLLNVEPNEKSLINHLKVKIYMEEQYAKGEQHG